MTKHWFNQVLNCTLAEVIPFALLPPGHLESLKTVEKNGEEWEHQSTRQWPRAPGAFSSSFILFLPQSCMCRLPHFFTSPPYAVFPTSKPSPLEVPRNDARAAEESREAPLHWPLTKRLLASRIFKAFPLIPGCVLMVFH